MKDAHGHGSEPRGVAGDLYRLMKPPSMIAGYPAHQTATVKQIPTAANADNLTAQLRAGVMPDLSNVTRPPAWIISRGRAARSGR